MSVAVPKYNPTDQNEDIVFKMVVIVFNLFVKYWHYGLKSKVSYVSWFSRPSLTTFE